MKETPPTITRNEDEMYELFCAVVVYTIIIGSFALMVVAGPIAAYRMFRDIVEFNRELKETQQLEAV